MEVDSSFLEDRASKTRERAGGEKKNLIYLENKSLTVQINARYTQRQTKHEKWYHGKCAAARVVM